MSTPKKKKKPKQWNERTLNRRNRKIKDEKDKRWGEKKKKKRKKKTQKKSYEQCEPKNKKILLSWLKWSQMPMVN